MRKSRILELFDYVGNTLVWKLGGQSGLQGKRAGCVKSGGTRWVKSRGIDYKECCLIATLNDTVCVHKKQGRKTGMTMKPRPGRLSGTTPSSNGKWCSKITIKGETRHLGTFPDEQEAHDAYILALKQYRESL
jgi:hypothetical protein